MEEVKWWVGNLSAWNGKALLNQSTDLTIETDASLQGWGAHYQGISTGGRRSRQESTFHINCLELLAGSLAVKCFTKNMGSYSVTVSQEPLGLVSKSQCSNTSTIHSRNSECRSGPRVQNFPGLQQLETPSSHFPSDLQQVGSSEYRPVRVSTHIPTRPICELEARSISSAHRCLLPRLGNISRLCISPILSNRSVSSACSESKGRTSSNSSL